MPDDDDDDGDVNHSYLSNADESRSADSYDHRLLSGKKKQTSLTVKT